MRVRGLLAVAAVGVVVLAGCADRQEGNDTLPTATTSAQASASLEPLGPADFPVPDEARKQTASGAEAALRYYIDLVSFQANIGGQPFRDLSVDCTFCSDLADSYDNDIAAGYSSSGGEATINSMSTPALDGDTAEFSFSLSQAPIAIFDANGQLLVGRGSPGFEDRNAGALMSWSPGISAWMMNQIVVNG